MVRRLTSAAEVTATRPLPPGVALCIQLPPAELILPVVGEVDGAVHFGTSVTVSTALPDGTSASSLNVTLVNQPLGSDGRRTSAFVRLVSTGGSITTFRPADVFNRTTPFVGPLVLAFASNHRGIPHAPILS